MTMHAIARTIPSLALLAALCGCGADRPAGFAAALPAPPRADMAAPAAIGAGDGAIFRASTGYAPLHYGLRARRVGDPLTVMLVERTVTTKAANGRTSRDGGFSITPPTAGPLAIDPGALKIGAGGSFKGQGEASQSSSLAGEITVTIAEVLPGGIARIRGEKVMTLSQGEEWIQLTGLIRLADISADNRVASPRVADARIAYSGKGSVQRAGREGWLSKFFGMVSPF